jgi:hypothetical protein
MYRNYTTNKALNLIIKHQILTLSVEPDPLTNSERKLPVEHLPSNLFSGKHRGEMLTAGREDKLPAVSQITFDSQLLRTAHRAKREEFKKRKKTKKTAKKVAMKSKSSRGIKSHLSRLFFLSDFNSLANVALTRNEYFPRRTFFR